MRHASASATEQTPSPRVTTPVKAGLASAPVTAAPEDGKALQAETAALDESGCTGGSNGTTVAVALDELRVPSDALGARLLLVPSGHLDSTLETPANTRNRQPGGDLGHWAPQMHGK
jgi:hypothetical protein